jgi:hypothetical protein
MSMDADNSVLMLLIMGTASGSNKVEKQSQYLKQCILSDHL